jgi:phosphoglycolate phosphatase-like HAD superfamily hydrolase
MKLLLLWDIDGTLIRSGGAGMRALAVALDSAFGIRGSTDSIEYSGRTDRWIMRQIFSRFGLPATEENFALYAAAYFAALPGQMRSLNACVLPGIRPILDGAIARGTVGQGLLTGNMRQGAATKLGYHGLWDYFPFGAFADDSELRDELGPHALRRARERYGVDFPPESVWVIGDTPMDIACARPIGANSLAVATGIHSAAELAGHRPTALLENLGDTDAFWKIVGE